MLGRREPEIYGRQTLADIIEDLELLADEYSVRLHSFQSNAEYEIIERIHEAMDDGTEFIIINPAAFTHTSVAIRDALAAVDIPFIEVHLSNIHKREPFRAHSYFSDLAVGVIAGLGAKGYELALQAAVERIK
ncbi:MAG: type II 3-dehydroquinate dehydratase [Thiotrichales bacterium]|nr:type II 3-dehydroquinate dehydratase [Thiotrichales bacterium]